MTQKNIILLFVGLFIGNILVAQSPTCKGVTKAGKPCKQTFLDSSGYCRYHNPNRILCAHPGCHVPVKAKGEYCRYHAPHAVHIQKQITDSRGLTSVWFTENGKEWALDFLTKHELDSLKAL